MTRESSRAVTAMAPPPSLGRSTAIMASGTAVSRALGFVRNALLAAAIGVNAAAADSFDIANKVPNALYAILAAGVLNAALVPHMVRALHRSDGKRIIDRVLTIGGVVSLVITAVFTLGASVVVSVYTPDWPDHQKALAVAFAFWCIPQLFFYGMYTLLGQVLNARSQFGPYMWAPVANNIISIAGLVIYLGIFGPYVLSDIPDELAADPWSAGRIALLAGTATLGIAVQALVLIWPLSRGGYRWRWVWSGPAGELRAVRVVALWALGAVLVEQVAVVLTTRVAAAANPLGAAPDIAGNAAYFHALMLYLVPHSLITLSILTALFTSLATYAAREQWRDLRREVARGLRVIGVFTVYATIALAVLAPYVVRVALPGVEPIVIESVARVLTVMALGLAPLGAMVLFKRVFFALQDGKAVFWIHVPMALAWVGVAYAVQWWAEPQWWTMGVAAGLVASSVVGALGRLGALRKRLGGVGVRAAVPVYAKATVAAVVAGGLAWAALHAVPDVTALVGVSGWLVAAATCAGGGILMLAVYGSILRWWGVDEWGQMLAPLLRRLRRVKS